MWLTVRPCGSDSGRGLREPLFFGPRALARSSSPWIEPVCQVSGIISASDSTDYSSENPGFRTGTSYTYDANGNRTTETDVTGSKAYTWDSRNRLTRLETPLRTITFRYDFAGNLIQQTTTDAGGMVTQNFLLDDLTNVAQETRSDGTSSSILTSQSIDSHLAVTRSNGTTEFGLSDGLNSTVATVNQAGAQTATLNYEPYGETTAASTYPFQYTGRVPVSENLYYYRARFYDAQVGQFISEDPIGILGGANLYRYATLLSGLFFEVWLKALCDGALGRGWKEGGCFWP